MANFTLVFWTYKLGISFYFLVSSQFLLCPEVCTVYIFPSLVDTVRFLRLLRMELFVFPPLSMFAIGIQEGCWLLWINIISCYFAEWVHQMSEFSGGLFYVENHIIWKIKQGYSPPFFSSDSISLQNPAWSGTHYGAEDGTWISLFQRSTETAQMLCLMISGTLSRSFLFASFFISFSCLI